MKSDEKRTFYNLLKRKSEQFADINALISGEYKINYSELFKKASELAAVYQKKGFSGKKIDLSPAMSCEWIIVFFALVMSGAIVVLHEPFLNVSEYIDDIYIKSDANELCFNESANGHTLVPQDENAVSLIIFTSGTSGRHKGVMLSQRNIISSAMIGVEKVGKGLLYPSDRSIPVLPLFHMFGITASIIAPMSLGMTLYIIDEMKYVIKSLSSIKPKILFAVPMIIKTMLNRALLLENKGLSPQKIKDEFFGGLTAVVSGGAALHPELIEQYERFGIQLLNGYGITECSPIVTASSYNDFEKGAVGRVNDLCCAEVKIIDGTVHVSGDIVMQGYYNDKSEPFKYIEGKKWFDTLDNGTIDSNGNLFIQGRQSNLIILDDGNNTAPEELEVMFEKYDIIGDIMVYEAHAELGNLIAASIYPNQELVSTMTETEVYAEIEKAVNEVNSRLPIYKRIKAWKIRKNDFLRTSLKKIIRTGVNIDE